ncbi:MAG: hypothetical protein IKA22_07770 [Lentisphaeria bacterium]|nr:hypothetical protein [Lentisphaeria bacterium]
MKIKSLAILIVTALVIPSLFAAKLPEELKGKKVTTLPGAAFNGYKGVEKPKDADSSFGQVVALSAKVSALSRNNGTNFGIYDKDKKILCIRTIKTAEIPQDEKYHLYKIGKCTLVSPNSYFFGTSSWMLQYTLKKVFKANAAPEDNTYEVYVSTKFTGPDYVKNSTKENKVSIEAVYLVK